MLGVLAALAVATIAFGFWGVPPLLKAQLERRGSALLQREVTVGAVAFNPLRLAVTIDGLAVAGRDGAPWAGWERLAVNFDAWPRLAGEWRFASVELRGFRAALRVDEAGELNVADMLDALQASTADDAAPGESEPAVWSVGRLVVENARVEWVDLSRAAPFATAVGPVSFAVEGLHSTRDDDSPYTFEARTEAGERLAWRGALSVADGTSTGDFELTGIALPKYMPYVGDRFRGEVRSGRLDVAGAYEIDWAAEEPVLRWRDGRVRLAGLVLGEPGAEATPVRIDELSVGGIAVDSRAMEARAATVQLAGGRIELTNTNEGVDVSTWLPPASAAPADGNGGGAVAPSSTAVEAWTVAVGDASVAGLAVVWTDRTLARPVAIEVAEVRGRLAEFSTADPGRALPLTLTLDLAGGGVVEVTGTAAVRDLAPSVEIDVRDVALAPWSGYLSTWSDAELSGGNLDVKGRLEGIWPAWRFAGATQLRELAVTTGGEQVAGWSELALTGLSVSLDPIEVAIDTVTLADARIDLAINEAGRPNWQEVMRSGAEDEGVAVTAPDASRAKDATGAGAPRVEVASVTLRNAEVNFTDRSAGAVAAVGLKALDGELTGLSSAEPTKGKFDLRGRVGEGAPVKLAGSLNFVAQPAFADLNVEVTNVDLRSASPYAAKYAGYPVTRGRATLATTVKLQDRILDTDTLLTIDGFTLGPRSDSPDATKLPVPLAVALLKDMSGRIVVDLPVEGDLDDPEFRIGRVVGRVLVNILTKTVTAPFSLLGSLVGRGADDDLSAVEFAPGTTTLSEAAQAKLADLATALARRPALQLEVTGGFAPEQDAAALRRAALDEQLRPLAWRMGEGRASPASRAPAGAPCGSTAPPATPRSATRLGSGSGRSPRCRAAAAARTSWTSACPSAPSRAARAG